MLYYIIYIYCLVKGWRCLMLVGVSPKSPPVAQVPVPTEEVLSDLSGRRRRVHGNPRKIETVWMWISLKSVPIFLGWNTHFPGCDILQLNFLDWNVKTSIFPPNRWKEKPSNDVYPPFPAIILRFPIFLPLFLEVLECGKTGDSIRHCSMDQLAHTG